MWSVVYFERVDGQRTRVTVSSLGFNDSPESKRMRVHFLAGNEWTVKKLQEKFAGSAKRTSTDRPATDK